MKCERCTVTNDECGCDCHANTGDTTERHRCALIQTQTIPPDAMTTDDMRKRYTVLSFLAPYVLVERISDGARGTLRFTHNPRFYFNFEAE